MKSILKELVVVAVLSSASLAVVTASAEDESFAPGGTAIDQSATQFHDQKIVMDLKADNLKTLNFGAMVASRILEHPGAKLVVIIEGPYISVFSKKAYLDHQGIVDEWAELAKRGVHVEYCSNSLKGVGLRPSDMGGLDERNPAVVNPGAFPSLAHYESMGYVPIIPLVAPMPAQKSAPRQ